MAAFKCKMCGGALEVSDGMSVITCNYCETKQTLPKLNDDKRTNLYDRANHFRRNNEYDKAMALYESILNDDTTDAEAYWSLVLCKYGVEYVEDPLTRRRMLTCNRTQTTSILAEEDYKRAIDHADSISRSIYEDEAIVIDSIQKGILEISSKEEPFDIFICYKEIGNDGRRTPDSVLAQEMYHLFSDEGLKVFFARITLEGKLGSAYEPYIFAALQSSKIMIVLGTTPQHFNAVWVKNEWSRYLALIKSGAKKTLIPAYRDIDAYDLPEEFSHLQAQDMGKLGFMQDMLRGVMKMLGRDKVSEAQTFNTTPGAESLMKRGWLFLEDSNCKQADEYFDRVLDIDPECASAYIGKLCAELGVRHEFELANQSKVFENNPDYQKALRFADTEYRNVILEYSKGVNERIAAAESYSAELRSLREHINRYNGCISARKDTSIGLRTNGSVTAIGVDTKYIKSGNSDIVAVAAGSLYAVSLSSDDTVIAVGESYWGNCNTGDWRNIVAIAAGDLHTLGLSADGSVVATGSNKHGQCNTGDWCDIATVAAGSLHTIGIKSDGNVIAVGNNDAGQCNTGDWRDIATVVAGDLHTVGLRKDGTVIAVGNNSSGQCSIDDWRDVVTVAAGSLHTLGIKSDGNVIAVGNNDAGQCDTDDWRDIVAVTAGASHSLGLRKDGTVVCVGSNKRGQRNAGKWRDIGPVDKELLLEKARVREEEERRKYEKEKRKREEEERPKAEERKQKSDLERRILEEKKRHREGERAEKIHSIYSQLTEEMRLLDITGVIDEDRVTDLADRFRSLGDFKDSAHLAELCDIKRKNIPELRRLAEQHKSEEKLQEEQHRIAWSNYWAQQGLCRSCGGQIGGVIAKKCKSCGAAS